MSTSQRAERQSECFELIDELQQIAKEGHRHGGYKADEFRLRRNAFKKAFAKRAPEKKMPTDEEIDQLLQEVLERSGAPEPAIARDVA